MGTELIASGLVLGEPPERWNIDFPERVLAVHRAYVAAGCVVIGTNTFGATGPRLKSFGMQDRVEELNRVAVELAMAAAGSSARVAGIVGPCGVAEPEAFRPAICALIAGGVDLIHIESMPSVAEASAALMAARSFDVEVWTSMSLRGPQDRWVSWQGDSPGPSLARLSREGADAVGFNCVALAEPLMALAAHILEHTDAVLVAQPNAGLPIERDGVFVYEGTTDAFGDCLQGLADAGVKLLGGCCGTTPAHLATASSLLIP